MPYQQLIVFSLIVQNWKPIFLHLSRTVWPTLRNIGLEPQNQQQQLIRKIGNHSITDFVVKLSYETWDTVFSDVDIDTKFNFFLNTYLRIYYSSFPLKKAKNRAKYNIWMTTGVKISCKHKRGFCLISRDSHDPKLKRH
jgi:hypothetical protein